MVENPYGQNGDNTNSENNEEAKSTGTDSQSLSGVDTNLNGADTNIATNSASSADVSSYSYGAQQQTDTQSVQQGVQGAQQYVNTQDTQFIPSTQSVQDAQNTQHYFSGQQIPYGGPTTVHPRATKQSKAKTFIWGLVGVIVGAAVAFGAIFAYESYAGQSTTETATSDNGTIVITAETTSADLAEVVAAKCLPSVVSIDVYTQSDQSQSLFGSLSGSSDSESNLEASSIGSGVILTEDGYILTNYHVIEDGSMYVVNFDDDTSEEAELVGYDESSDLAVLKVSKTGLTPMDIGDSDAVTVGEWVMALGTPFGLTKSVSAGIVSALYRNQTMTSSSGTTIYANMIQIDADINPGNSGGALVNAEGELIGINTLITSTTGQSAGIGFAIPSNYALNIANQIIENGYAEHPYLGVTLGTIDAASQGYYGTNVSSGVYVVSVIEESPAEAAGLQEGDVITAYNGEEVTTSSELIIMIRSSEIGETVDLTVNRNGTEITISATLGTDASS